MELVTEAAGENLDNFCDCCGNRTNTVWGYVYRNDVALAAYFVHWTSDKPDHDPNFDFIFGTWGDESVEDKKLSSWIYNPTGNGTGSFMAIDSKDRPLAESDLCSVALSREQVVNNSETMELMTNIIDAIWLQDARIQEVVQFGQNT